MAENLYSCGCHEVDGVLVTQCTQNFPSQEVAAHQLGRPYAKVCFRPVPEPEPEKTQPEVSPEPKKRKGPEAVKDSE